MADGGMCLRTTPTWRLALAGLAGSLIVIGLARFAYTALIPPLIEQGWLTPAAAHYGGAANLAGYVIGAWAGRRIASAMGARAAIRGGMIVATLSFITCAWPLPGAPGVAWFEAWRLIAGIAGGIVMVLAAPALLPHVPPSRHGVAAGAIFTGVGLGILISGMVMPALLSRGLTVAWLTLGAAAAALTALVWRDWPPASVAATLPKLTPTQGLLRLCVAYGLNAFGLVPFMVFLVDYVARFLGHGNTIGAAFWALFGVAATAGALLAGALADRIGARRATVWALAAQAVAVAAPLLTTSLLALAAASIVAGACVTGVLPLTLNRVRAMLPAAQATAGWSRATTFWALGQAGAGYLDSWLIGVTGSLTVVFASGAATLVVALALVLAERDARL